MRGWGRTATVLLVLAGLLACSQAWGEGTPALKVKLKPVMLLSRSDSPVMVDVEFDWSGTNLLTGSLEMTVRSGRDVLERCSSNELALRNGVQTVRMMLPNGGGLASMTQVDVDLALVTKEARIPCGSEVLVLGATDSRRLVLCVCHDGGLSVSRPHERLMRGMRLDRSKPEYIESEFIVATTEALPGDMPASALGYTGCDVVLVTGSGLAGLRQPQLEALYRWVQAGGSVCVQPGRGLKAQHLGFLKKLCPSWEMETVGIGGGSGEGAGSAAMSGKRARFLRCGLGRVVLVAEDFDPGEKGDGSEWFRASLFLWKVRYWESSFAEWRGRWRTRDERSMYSQEERKKSQQRMDRAFGSDEDLDSMGPVGRQLSNMLRPTSVRMIPPGMVVGLLVGFLVLVGPVDYFVLGWLKLRKLTWVTFPIWGVGFTLFTVGLSNAYLGQVDQRGVMTVVDVGEGGEVLRWNRFELLFAAGERESTTDVSGCLFTPVGITEVEGAYSYPSRTRYWRGGSMSVSDSRPERPPVFIGRVPTEYTVRQHLYQWTPQLNRIASFSGEAPAVKVNWGAVTLEGLKSQGKWGEMGQALCEDGGAATGVYIFHGYEAVQAVSPSNLHKSSSLQPGLNWAMSRMCASGTSGALLHRMCVKPERELFELVSRVSPSGGSNLDDLPVLDATDPGQWLVVVVTCRDKDLVVYRRLYCEGSDELR